MSDKVKSAMVVLAIILAVAALAGAGVIAGAAAVSIFTFILGGEYGAKAPGEGGTNGT